MFDSRRDGRPGCGRALPQTSARGLAPSRFRVWGSGSNGPESSIQMIETRSAPIFDVVGSVTTAAFDTVRTWRHPSRRGLGRPEREFDNVGLDRHAVVPTTLKLHPTDTDLGSICFKKEERSAGQRIRRRWT